ncbi:hypothetical protein [Caulobacter sp. NIBR1757]|uniref:hypothetical protein n=1 Tax=Caulobacter sp. NIBR1757 TaxID=3016000 RepID=UPI0022F10687|nr:hypothetical protein [Caulobacter sp. NIBR1757]WGM40332.1 hypothetical protein AMEJIAPC_03276 [Caulobacter sp. NIBR1757]
MTENRPPTSDRKLSLVAPVVIGAIVIVLLAALLFLNREPKAPAPEPAPPPPPVVKPPPEKPGPQAGPLTRQDLIEGATLEAAAYSAGSGSPKALAEIKGRPFALRIPFGCEGPQVSPGPAQAFVEQDPAGKVTKLVARPGNWSALPMLQNFPSGAKPEAVEGFWLARPWSTSEACPPRRDVGAPATPTPTATQTLGLARLFEPGGSRLLRRDGRPYEFVRKTAVDQPPLAVSYRLVLEGRIATFPDGRTIRCAAESPDHRPICLYAVTFDRIAFETADGQSLAEWRE